MREKIRKYFLVRGLLLSTLLIALLTMLPGPSEAADFFTNSQTTDQRSNGTDGNPGYNPCVGGVLSVSACTGGTGMLTHIPTFITLGPGSVTDNMFGLVSGAALGALGAVGGTGFNVDTAVTKCAPGFGTSGGDPNGLRGLNCGDVRINPGQQGQTIPTTGTNLTAALISNVSMDMNSGTGASLHHSQIEGGFIWNPTLSAVTLPVTPANMPTVAGIIPTADSCAAGTALNPSVCGQQSMQETTGLSATTTVKVDQVTSWSTTNSAAGTMGPNPTVSWRMRINQADVVGTGGAFVQELSGSFEYNGLGATFPSTQYPDGESFTNGSIAGANLP